MMNPHADYRRYLELYEYFGHGIPRLTADDFATLDAELAALIGRAPDLHPEDVQRAVALKELLLRDHPKVEHLTSRRSTKDSK
jgi:hypothetical protein